MGSFAVSEKGNRYYDFLPSLFIDKELDIINYVSITL
jgi:hypothetical protein